MDPLNEQELALTGEVIEMMQNGRVRKATVLLKGFRIELADDLPPDIHLGDTVRVEARVIPVKILSPPNTH
jgi:hypothetical protein